MESAIEKARAAHAAAVMVRTFMGFLLLAGALPSLDHYRSGTARVHPRRGAKMSVAVPRGARACHRDLSLQWISPARSVRYRQQRTNRTARARQAFNDDIGNLSIADDAVAAFN